MAMTAADIRAVDRRCAEHSEAHLIDFIRNGAWDVVEPGFEFHNTWLIGAITEHLEAVTAGQITRLLINMPPRCMKSLLVSVFWPCWEWVKDPRMRRLFFTYSQDLTVRDSQKRRNIIRSDWFQSAWGDKFAITQDRDLRYDNSRTGFHMSSSTGGMGTGEGGHGLAIDDPASAEDAASPTKRETVTRWLSETVPTRLNDQIRGSIVLVQQRFHEDDSSGYIIAKELGYIHLCLPMRFESERKCVIHVTGWQDPRTTEGELLWPERFPEPVVARLERELGPYGAAGQLQQRPAPRGGGMFQRDWFQIVDAIPAGVRIVRFWDFAGTEGGGDWTVGLKMGLGDDGIFYIIDVRREQYGSAGVERLVKHTAKADGVAVPIYLEQEPGSAGKDRASYYITRVLPGFIVQAEPATGSKEIRAAPLASQAEVGNVKLLRGAWNDDFLSEAEIFPNGTHDDQIDAASGAFGKLIQAKGGFGARLGHGMRKPMEVIEL